MEKFIEVTSNFGMNLLKEISAGQETNSFLSPVSITMALAMTYAGAEGNTKNQMNRVMFSELNEKEINENLDEVVRVINKPTEAYILRTANRLYVEKSCEVLQTYLDVVRKHFHSDCISSDFKQKSEAVRQEINNWVEQMTNNKITNLLSSDFVNPDSRLILVNAIYFKGDWQKAFEETKTCSKPFHVSPSEKIDVDMMYAKLKTFLFFADKKCKVLGIPYKSKDLAMFILLPSERNGLAAFEKQTNGHDLIELIRNVCTSEVEVELPKFKLEQSFDLVEKLTKLGMSDMFSNGADFSKLSGSKDLVVSAVVHKAFIEVNEKGSEAAAATAVKIVKRCAVRSPESKSFIADHPFLFAIVERKTNSILFLGHYYGK